MEKRFVGDDGAFREAVPAAANAGFFLEEEVGLLVDPEGGVRGGHSCLTGHVFGGGGVEMGLEDPAFATEDGGFALEREGVILGEILHPERNTVGGSGTVSGLDWFAVAGDEAEDASSFDDEDIEGVPVGLAPLAGEFGAVVANIFAAEVVLDARVQILLGLQDLIKEGSRILRAEHMNAEK